MIYEVYILKNDEITGIWQFTSFKDAYEKCEFFNSKIMQSKNISAILRTKYRKDKNYATL